MTSVKGSAARERANSRISVKPRCPVPLSSGANNRAPCSNKKEGVSHSTKWLKPAVWPSAKTAPSDASPPMPPNMFSPGWPGINPELEVITFPRLPSHRSSASGAKPGNTCTEASAGSESSKPSLTPKKKASAPVKPALACTTMRRSASVTTAGTAVIAAPAAPPKPNWNN